MKTICNCKGIDNLTLGIYKIFEDVEIPGYATLGSCCFDLRAYLRVETVVGYSPQNEKEIIEIEEESVIIKPFHRVLIPTGMKFHIPVGHSMRIHPRSGMALKNGLILANCEGVIDYDYPEQTFVLAMNVSNVPVKISHGERIAQAEIVPMIRVDFSVLTEDVSQYDDQYSTRTSGLGSTGTK